MCNLLRLMCNMMQADYMQLVREAFMEKDAMAVIVGLVAEPLSRHPRMSEADGLIVQLVITFIRNLLVIPDRAATAGHTAIWQLTLNILAAASSAAGSYLQDDVGNVLRWMPCCPAADTGCRTVFQSMGI